ncbi:MAG: deoxyribonuclease IV [Planctomycetota bacterium]|nr:deoxyribonuclease IV [Planctomycetota bacterium]
MRIGVHIPIGSGFERAAEYAVEAGCETVQLFSCNPRGWEARELPLESAENFKTVCRERSIEPVIVHMPYLPNLASADRVLWQRSVKVVVRELERAELLGARFLVSHTGKAKEEKRDSLKRVAEGVNEALETVGNSVILLLENTAGQGSEVGSHFEELQEILEDVDGKDRVGICFDTAHGFQAGYDLRNAEAIERVVRVIKETVGTDRIKCIHLNDSKTPLGSRVDRHWHVAEGEIGREGFVAFLAHPAFVHLPMIMETPKETSADDKRNIEKVFTLLGRR